MKKAVSNISRAFSTVEVMLASAVFGLLVTAIVGGVIYGRESTVLSGNHFRAQLLAEEGLEATRNIRDSNFASLVDGDHGLNATGNVWSFAGVSDTTGIYSRVISIAPIDINRKTVTSKVTWQQNNQRTGTVTLVTRLTNWLATVTPSWTNPVQQGHIDLAGDEDGLKVDISGSYAYVVRADGTPDFVIIDITAPSEPTIVGSLNLTGIPANIYVSGTYAYVTNSDNDQELQIIDISTPSTPTVVATYNATGDQNALGIFILDNTAYLLRENGDSNELVILNVTSPTLPLLLGSQNLNGTGYEIVVVGTNAYIATGYNAQELQIVNVLNPISPSLVGWLELPGNTDAITISVTGNTVLVGQENKFYTIDVTTPSSPVRVGSVLTYVVVLDIALDFSNPENFVFLASGANTEEFQEIDISVLSTPTLVTTANVAGNYQLNGVDYSPDLDCVVGAGVSNDEEIIIFAPQT
ncbi:hypothetical protein HY844_00180 [Candidatus Berkelbacteria bacterium]|nr:hypothetical protein [Candidatus Berkelbacteria bacterium]